MAVSLIALASCDGGPPARDGAARSPATSPAPLPRGETPESDVRVPTYTPIERRVIADLRDLGIDAGVAEHGYRDAQVSGRWRGMEILIHAYHVSRRDVAAIDAGVVAREKIGDVTVTHARNRVFGPIRIFVCRRFEYRVSKLGGDWDPDVIDAFLPRFIDAVGC